MLESKIQANIIKLFNKHGWVVLKIIKCNMNGISDLILFKDGKTLFIEVKSDIGKPSPMQLFRQKQLRQQGFTYEIINSLEQCSNLI
jgi:Holliday junction resolvase